ncbi:MAG TPA: right-handed parallel beta-helix repeat-containing protein [Bryobacteraceae bacterium]|nr:right-handed parallel beta-helix repeat-containing protein [Bryobacteraceae bacterium]
MQGSIDRIVKSVVWLCALLAGAMRAEGQERTPADQPIVRSGAGVLASDAARPDVVTARDFGAAGDGVANDTAALQDAFAAACAGSGKLYVPAGTYNISSPLTTGCAMFIFGDGATLSIIRQTVQRSANHGIISSHSLTLQDIGINTAPLRQDYGMAAVFRSDTASPASGQTFAFIRYNSAGFNFGLDVAGTSTADQLDAVTVQDCDISVGTAWGAVSQPVNVRTARSVLVENNTLTGDANNDHAIYLIAARMVVIRNNTIARIQNSAVKILNGGFCGRSPGCPPDTGQDYAGWTIENNRISNAAMAIAVYLYGTTELPLVDINHNEISDIADTYAGDAAAIYVNVNDSASMAKVSVTSNVYRTLSLGGVFLVTSGQGTVKLFEDRGDKFINWSVFDPGTYYAISSSGAGLGGAVIEQLSMDAQGHGRAALNLKAFSRVNETKAEAPPTPATDGAARPRTPNKPDDKPD